MTTEAPFSATLNIDIMGSKVLLTARHDTGEGFLENWAFLAEQMPTFVVVMKTALANANAAPITAAPAATTPQSSGWGSFEQATTPPPSATPTAQPPSAGWSAPTPPAASPTGTAPLCDHGQPMKLIPPGISKTTGKPRSAFYACPNPQGSQCKKFVWV